MSRRTVTRSSSRASSSGHGVRPCGLAVPRTADEVADLGVLELVRRAAPRARVREQHRRRGRIHGRVLRDDRAEGHHDVTVIDGTGKLLAKCRIGDDLEGYQVLLDLLADHGDTSSLRSQWRSRPAAGCWSPRCGRVPARSSRSIRWRPPAIATVTA